MKNKAQKIARLKEELLKYCKQIGILEDEIPTLVFSIEEWNQKQVRAGSLRRRDRAYGRCSFSDRLIIVRVSDYKYNRTIKQLIHTLIHELVHYKWQWLPHGRKFEERIKEVKKGRIWLYKEVVMRVDCKKHE